MRRDRRRALSRLPVTASSWEVALVDVPVRVPGVDVEGVLVVMETDSGHVRGAGPIVRGEALTGVLEQAFASPTAPCAPGRARRLLCADAALARRLEAELDGVGVEVVQVDRVPGVEEVVGSLLSAFGPPTAPGIHVESRRFATALHALCRAAPWEHLPDGVRFGFSGIDVLEGAVAVVLGAAGEQRGVALYPSAADHDLFLEAATGRDPSALERVEAVNVFLDPFGELAEDEQEACRRLGLALPRGLAPRVLHLFRGELRVMAPKAQRGLLAAVEGVVALWAEGGAALAREQRSCRATTVLGEVTVHASPQAPPIELLVGSRYGVAMGPIRTDDDDRERTALIVKVRKRDAERAARLLRGVDELRLLPGTTGYLVRAFRRGEDLGALIVVGEREAEVMGSVDGVVLCLSGGGPDRQRILPREFVFMEEVAVTGAERAARRSGHDAVFDGPIEGWPKASGTLWRFAEPVFGGDLGELPERVLLGAAQTAARVWNAVTMADFAHDERFLDDVRRSAPAGADGLIDALVARKRKAFAGDPRLFADVRVESRRGRPELHVSSKLPPGYAGG